MTQQTLSPKQLNRTLLSRQLLLHRHQMYPADAIEKLVGLQSQIPNPPYIGLWTRLQTFERDHLTKLMEARKVVRAPMMRSTLHLVTDEDHQKFQPIIQPALDRALRAFFGKDARELDIDKLVKAARPFIEEEPRTTGEIKQMLLDSAPDKNGDAMAYAVRNNLQLVQVPPGGTWGTGTRASYTTAQSYLGDPTPSDLETLLHRYLAAFGPASIMDFQAWVGIASLTKTIKPMMKDLVTYETEDGTKLLDLPHMEILPEDTPTPIRFIPEYDNLLVSHKDRNRIIADDDRKYVFLSAARVLGTVLIDGFVGATWKTEREKDVASLRVSLFEQVDGDTIEAIDKEGQKLIRFIEDDAEAFVVEFDVYND